MAFALAALAAVSVAVPRAATSARHEYLWQCLPIGRDDARHRCYARLLLERVEASGDPARELPRIDRDVRELGGEVAGSCHALMHEVGRRYARAHRVTLATLRRYVPRSSDPTCSAGFGMGLVMYVGPELTHRGADPLGPCDELPTRFREYTCIHGIGHALMRGYHGDLRRAVRACRRVGRHAPDCAQGAFHDYWIALRGGDGTRKLTGVLRSPRYVCDGRYGFVRPCWYRYFIEQPLSPVFSRWRDIDRECRLPPLQRQGCISGAALAASTDPFEQLRICAPAAGADASSCVRGLAVPAVAQRPRRQRALIRGCGRLGRSGRVACYEWLGRTLAIVTDGRFDCRTAGPGRAACRAGSRRSGRPLIGFA